MTTRATISFSQPGVQPPVYVVTSLSNPPWETLELAAEGGKTSSGDLIFIRHFDHVVEGNYQYKIRVGEGHWVVDESKQTATDEHGNRNNVIQVKAPPPDVRKDSTMDTSGFPQLSRVPVPLVVLEKVEDQEQPEIGSLEPQTLPVDVAKRAADAEPDLEVTRANPPVEAKLPNAPEMRVADALPNELAVIPEDRVGPVTEEDQAAPLFQHELSQSESLPTDTIDQESVQSSTDQTSSGDVLNTPPEADEMFGDDELNHSPLLSHETGLSQRTGELDSAPKLSHEVDIEEDDGDELNNVPLFSHETCFLGDSAIHSDDEHELSKAPLLSHETGFSQFKGSHVVREHSDDEVVSPHCKRYFKGRLFESDHAQTFSHETRGDHNFDEDDVPLLSHERSMSAISVSGSERSLDDGLFLLDKQPAFRYETPSTRELFGRSNRASIFKTGTGNSTLPHKMPKSDEEDDALHDVSLESFPTSREQILERVATIGHHLPEDQVVGEQHSPPLSVMSQACSSVDLRPIRSYASMPSVQEESDDDDQDMKSLGSPVMMGDFRLRNSGSYSGFAKDPYATPVPGEHKRFELTEDFKIGVPSTRTAKSSEADSVDKHDGAKDLSAPLTKLADSVATPAKVLNSLAAPLISNEKSVPTGKERTDPALESEDGQHREQKESSVKVTPNPTASSEDTKDGTEDKMARAVTSAAPQQQLGQTKENKPYNFFRAAFGSVGHFVTVCLGDWKRTSISVFVAGSAVAAYYYSMTWA